MNLTSRKHWTVGNYATITEDCDGDLVIDLKASDLTWESDGIDAAVECLDSMFRDLGEALGYEISAEEG